MSTKERGWLSLFGAILLVFIGSGAYVLYATEIAPTPPPSSPYVSGFLRIAYGFHLMTWMLLGMLANYWWDHFRSGRGWDEMLLRDILLPVLISPIIFFSIWSLWPGKEITFAVCLVAFQNGFFWQVVFSRAGPVGPRPEPPPAAKV
jgi:hypothetical protein